MSLFLSVIHFLHWYSLFSCFSCNHYCCCAIHYRELSPHFFSFTCRQNTLSQVSKKHKRGCFSSACMTFAFLFSGTCARHEQMLILKIGTQLNGDFTDGELASAHPEFLHKGFFSHWRTLIGLKWNCGNVSVSILLVSWSIPKSRMHFSIAARLQSRRLRSYCNWREIGPHTKKGLSMGLWPPHRL